MGLFDFIKKKLFGKTKKVDEPKKLEKKIESKDIEKPLIPSKSKSKKVTKEKKKVAKKIKDEKPKKGILSKIKDNFISYPEDKVIKEKISKPKTLKKDDKINKLSKVNKDESKFLEEPKEEKVIIEDLEEEVIEEPKEEKVIIEDPEEAVIEEPQTITHEDADSLKKGLEKTKKSFFSKLKSAVLGKSKIDDDVLDELEEVLITSDVGVETTVKIIKRIEERVSKDKYTSINELNNILKEEIVKILAENSSDLDAFDVSEDTVPYVILVVGVNGVGKTTTIGKLAAQFKEGGLKVLIGAADTFRAAAVDQIQMWGKKVGVDVVSHGMNTDPASVAYDTVKRAVEEKYHVVIIDTAGRLHTKLNLMNELSKIKRVVQKFKEDAPHEVMLILDGSTGQNAFVQAEEFTKATDVNSITITKLDGTAKGGVVIGITDRFKIPIKYVGVGEKVGDLKLFHKGEFVSSFFD